MPRISGNAPDSYPASALPAARPEDEALWAAIRSAAAGIFISRPAVVLIRLEQDIDPTSQP